MWHKPCRTFHPWCLCIKTRCLSVLVIATDASYANTLLINSLLISTDVIRRMCVCTHIISMGKSFYNIKIYFNIPTQNMFIGHKRRFCPLPKVLYRYNIIHCKLFCLQHLHLAICCDLWLANLFAMSPWLRPVPRLNKRPSFTGIGIPMLNIRRS